MSKSTQRLLVSISIMLLLLNMLSAQQAGGSLSVQPLDKSFCLTGGWEYENAKASIGGQICDAYAWLSSYTMNNDYWECRTGFDIRGFDLITMKYGVSDSLNAKCKYTVVITIDGNDVVNEIVNNNECKLFNKQITNAKNMLIKIKYNVNNNNGENHVFFFGDPKLIKGNITTPQTNPIDRLATAIRKHVEANPDLKDKINNGYIAMMTFNLIDIQSPAFAKNVAEDLSARLINSGFQLIERGHFDKALKDLNIQDDTMIDPATALKLGQLTGCNYIIVGSISNRGQFFLINTRILDTATGKTVVADFVDWRKNVVKQ